jgi:hypothetical protein
LPFKLKALLCALVLAQGLSAQKVHIGVLSLFRPSQLILKATPALGLVVQAGTNTFMLEGSSGHDAVNITASGEGMVLQLGGQSVKASAVHVAGRSGGASDFLLVVPGKISRRYRGVLDVKVVLDTLVPIISMDLEAAVASVVAAESDTDAPMEALKAQSVATRSYLVAARDRHHDFDFCDTTHCQFLREPPAPSSGAFRATLATRGLVLSYRDQPIAAMFTRSCGGRTYTPEEVGMAHLAYPYYSVVCDYCRRRPPRWTRRLSRADAVGLQEKREASRIVVDRRLGWDAVPSDNFAMRTTPEGVVLEGAGEGHGIGLCQRGAKAMAQAAASFREILAHYYPNTTLTEIDPK